MPEKTMKYPVAKALDPSLQDQRIQADYCFLQKPMVSRTPARDKNTKISSAQHSALPESFNQIK